MRRTPAAWSRPRCRPACRAGRPRRASWPARRPPPGSRRRSAAASAATTSSMPWAARCSTSVDPCAAERAQLLARGHRRGAAGVAGEDHGLGHAGDGQLAAQRRRGGGERGHAGDDVVGHAERVQPAHLLGHRAVDRRVAGVQPGDVVAAAGGRRRSSAMISSRSRCCGVDQPGARRRMLEHLARHQRARVQADRRARDQRAGARTVIRSAAPGPAPMKWTVIACVTRPLDDRAHAGLPAGEAAERLGMRDRQPGQRAAVLRACQRDEHARPRASPRWPPAGRRCAAPPSTRRAGPARSAPPPTNTASGGSRVASASGAAPRTSSRCGTPSCRALRSMRSARSVALLDRDGAARWARPAATRCRSSRCPRRRPTAAARGSGASAASVAARTSRLVSCAVVLVGLVGQAGDVGRAAACRRRRRTRSRPRAGGRRGGRPRSRRCSR